MITKRITAAIPIPRICLYLACSDFGTLSDANICHTDVTPISCFLLFYNLILLLDTVNTRQLEKRS